MVKHFAIAALVIVLFAAGAILLVNRLTDYPTPPRSAAERAAAGAASSSAPDLPVYAQPPADFSQQGPGAPIVIPAGPMVGGAVQNESPPIQGPPPVPLPQDPGERGEAISNIRRDRINSQMDRINRRNQERLGQRPDQSTPEPPSQ